MERRVSGAGQGPEGAGWATRHRWPGRRRAAGCVRPAAARTALLWSRAFSRRFRLGASPFPKENVASQRVASRLLTFWFSVSTPWEKRVLPRWGCGDACRETFVFMGAQLGRDAGLLWRRAAPGSGCKSRKTLSVFNRPSEGPAGAVCSLWTPTAGVGAAEFRAPGAPAASWMLWFLSQPLGLC